MAGWWFGCHFWHFPINIGFMSSSRHWRSPSFFRGVGILAHQPDGDTRDKHIRIFPPPWVSPEMFSSGNGGGHPLGSAEKNLPSPVEPGERFRDLRSCWATVLWETAILAGWTPLFFVCPCCSRVDTIVVLLKSTLSCGWLPPPSPGWDIHHCYFFLGEHTHTNHSKPY